MHLSLTCQGHTTTQPTCEVQCTLSTSQEDLSRADAIVFDALVSTKSLRSFETDLVVQNLFGFGREFMTKPVFLPEKPPHQLWVNFGYEHHKMVSVLGTPSYFVS